MDSTFFSLLSSMAPLHKPLLSSSHSLSRFPFSFTLLLPRQIKPILCRTSATSLEPDGAGAAAPTRGEIFLDCHNARSVSSLILKQTKTESNDNVTRNNKKINKKKNKGVVSCYGCGAPLQTVEVDAPGFVESDTYELKKRHRQLRTVLCGRCRLLSHGHMITAVGGHGGYPGGKQFISAEELREKLSHLRHEKVLIVKLVDIVDFNGSFLARVRDLAGANPIILVATKVDLLPRDTDLNCIGDWVVEATVKKKLNVISVHLTSSKSLVGIAGVISEIQKEKKGRDVYILGSANVGKSAFINSLLKMMAEKDPVAAAAQKYKPLQSAVPGTTLGPIQIEAFRGGGKLFDTPGVHLHHRQAAVVHSEDLPSLAPQSRLRGRSFPVENRLVNDQKATSLDGFSIFWGGLVRIDILKALPQTRLTFYGPRKVPTRMVLTAEADEFYKREVGISLTPPTRKERAEIWKGLEAVRHLQINPQHRQRPACDIAISGLGWIAVEPFGQDMGSSGALDSADGKNMELLFDMHVPKAVEVFIRPPMPVGKAGEEWYEYAELTEMEEELRPKWHY